MRSPRGVGRDQVLAAGARLAREAARFSAFGWMRGSSGNLSEVHSRDPLLLAVTASGLDMGELRPTDIAVVDHAGRPVDFDGLERVRPSVEARFHAHIAAVTGARFVFHAHSLNVVEASLRWPKGPVLRGLEMIKALGRDAHDDTLRIPVIGNSQNMAELSALFDADREEVPAVLVSGHGGYVWGADVLQARHRAEALDWLLSLALRLR